MSLLRLCVLGWWVLGLLSGCQREPDAEGAAPAGITADNYLTAIPDPKTLGETYVSDPDQVLQPGTIAALNARLDSLDRSRRAHIDVVVVRSIGEAVPKTAATALFNRWKIGEQATNNGLLILLVLDQRRVEFETGYGLEADLPDIICFRIQQRFMLEPARAGNYDQAVQLGVAALIRRLSPAPPLPRPVLRTAQDSTQYYVDSLQHALKAQHGLLGTQDPLDTALPGEDLAGNYSAPESSAPIGILVVAFLTLILYLVLWYCTTRGLPGRGWLIVVPLALVVGLLVLAFNYGVADSTWAFLLLAYGLPLLYLHGYFGWQYYRAPGSVPPLERPQAYKQRQMAHRGLAFTAYLFPLGLMVYWSWYRRHLATLRTAPFACPTCGQPMQLLKGKAEKRHLLPGHQAEEAIKTIDYDVWECANEHTISLAYPNPDSEVRECPACKHRTLKPGRLRVEQAATTQAAGWGWQIETCHFCKHEEKTREVIPRLPDPSTRTSSSSSYSSSSNSSSSSSSSSSSGGSSGGGGAGSSW
ncbi:TPM domain-containing protein [Hymenobacter endophyticus]|uniref:TPM domain-containing protein n=1 Tax=Hymenobacter endophyticus TaxID=3076335 RepID=A0ABU3TN86_9BACT|nr:TPM domain-containing protein [Hymenobacter endophyticus]MDU0372856.1 TPM domain-containing protein [Hymenobacter endophyticus]